MVGGVQLLRLELDVQPSERILEQMECEIQSNLTYCHHCQQSSQINNTDISCEEFARKYHCCCRQDDYSSGGVIPGSACRLYDSSTNARLRLLLSNQQSSNHHNRLMCSSTPSCHHFSSYSTEKNPLEELLSGNIIDNWSNVTEAVKLLITFKKGVNPKCPESTNCIPHPYLTSRDGSNNTPFLYAGRKLLKQGAFKEAFYLSELFIEAGSDINAANCEGRTLLTYSVQYLDDSYRLTKLLVNSGAEILPADENKIVKNNLENSIITHFNKHIHVYNEKNSVFTWFLRSIIRSCKLDTNSLQTLTLLCEVMGENPARMHSHVMRTMFRHAKCYKILGPVFYQLKSLMLPYWSQPKDLKYLCRKKIRKLITPAKLKINLTNNQLGLPNKMLDYLLLE